MKSLLFLLFTLLFASPLLAANYKGIEYSLEPIYGYQKLELKEPHEHVKWEYFYGARITGGYKSFTLEGMYSKTEVDETFLGTGEISRNVVEKLKLGFSSSYNFNSWSLALLRIGAEIKQVSHHSITLSGTTSTKKEEDFSPYLGIGFEIYLKKFVAITLGVTAIFNEIPDDMWNNDYEYTSGVKILY